MRERHEAHNHGTRGTTASTHRRKARGTTEKGLTQLRHAENSLEEVKMELICGKPREVHYTKLEEKGIPGGMEMASGEAQGREKQELLRDGGRRKRQPS